MLKRLIIEMNQDGCVFYLNNKGECIYNDEGKKITEEACKRIGLEINWDNLTKVSRMKIDKGLYNNTNILITDDSEGIIESRY